LAVTANLFYFPTAFLLLLFFFPVLFTLFLFTGDPESLTFIQTVLVVPSRPFFCPLIIFSLLAE